MKSRSRVRQPAIIKTGDLITIYRDGKGSGEDVIDGLILKVNHIDNRAKINRDDYSRWFRVRMLVGGRPVIVNAYWEDEIEVHR